MLGITDDEYNIGTFRPTSNKVHYVSSPIGPRSRPANQSRMILKKKEFTKELPCLVPIDERNVRK